MALTKITGEGVGTINDLTVDTNTLHVDSTNNRVGIGTASPADVPLSVFSGGAGTNGQLKLGYDATAYWQIGRLDPAGTGSGNFQFKPNGGTSVLDVDTSGHVTMPNQSAFSAKRNATLVNAANNSYISFVTEAFDQNGDFSGDTFTAPVSGRYQLNFITRIDQIDRDSNWVRFTLETSNQTVDANILDPGVFAYDPAYWNFTIAYLADMDASDTAKVKFQFDGGSQIADISTHSYFSGYLVA